MSERARHEFAMAMAVVVGLSLTVSSVPAQTPPANKLQLKCQTSLSKALVKFVQSKAKCAQQCLEKARKTSGPYTGCEPPDFTDPKTNACIFDPKKGAEAKAGATISKGCAADCPACYEFICPDVAQVVVSIEELVDSIGVQFFCLEVAGQTPTKQEAKCEDAVAKTLATFLSKKAKCYQNCITSEFKGKIPANGCVAPSPADVATQDCIAKAETKAVASIDKVCVTVPGNPACYPPDTSGADWIGFGEDAVDSIAPGVYCGSPSGAFLE